MLKFTESARESYKINCFLISTSVNILLKYIIEQSFEM